MPLAVLLPQPIPFIGRLLGPCFIFGAPLFLVDLTKPMLGQLCHG